LGSSIEFITLEPDRTYEVSGLSVTSIKQFHTGDSYGYRFSQGGKSIVYSTDCEHKSSQPDETYQFVEFYRNADLLIFYAMYSRSGLGHRSAARSGPCARTRAGRGRLGTAHRRPRRHHRIARALL